MKRANYIISIVFLILISVDVSAQRSRAWRAYAAYESGEFHEAIDLLKDAYDIVNDRDEKTEILFKIADCYRRTNNPRLAETWFRKTVNRDYSDPLGILYFADMLRMNEKYEEARDEYQKYKNLVPEDPRGDNGMLSCDLAIEWLENPSNYIVENMKFFNNNRSNDFSPAFARDDYREVYFTSTRDEATGNAIHGATGQNFADIFVSLEDRRGRWSTPVPLEGDINTEFEEGTPSINSSFNRMYFTRCRLTKNKKMGCQIYTSSRSGDSWGDAQPIQILGDSLVAAHPAISPDELTLYFVSDIEGGVGGKDIWKVTRSDIGAEWSEPVNLGEPINTPGDEVFPYVHPDGTLYFASNGHIGMGGLDIYKASKTDDGSWNIENMRPPINSSADDFGIVFQAGEEKGFFSSSRGPRGVDDIYSFLLPPLRFNITGIVRDENTNEIIADAQVRSIGSDGITQEAKTGTDGSFRFMLNPNTDYVFIASKEGYLNGRERETTKGQTSSTDFRATIFLASIEKPIELPNIFYDFARWDLRPESMVSLDRLVETLNDNPHVTIELMSHTDSRGTAQANLELSQKRAQSVVDYLIEKGIARDRLTARGYGESQPKNVDESLAQQYDFLNPGMVLTEEFINGMTNIEMQETAHQINRRTEFRVLSTDYNK
jgi:peptidoglycan-associated lipoprotein